MELNKIYNQDCMIGMGNIKDKSIDLILTDIPYGEVNRKSNGLRNLDKKDADEFNINIEQLMKTMIAKCKGSMYVFCGTKQISSILQMMEDSGMSTRMCVWQKSNPSPMNGDKIWLSGLECCAYGKFPKATFNEHCKGTVWKYPCGRSKVHPTQKPLELFEYLVSVSSKENDLVLDPFMGSGTTAIACLNLNRKFIGFELSKEYFNIANNRIENLETNGK